MIEVSVTSNVADVIRRLNQVQRKQVPFATALALTKTAQAVRAAEYKELQAKIDRPTQYTLNSLFLEGAKPSKLYARVWLKDAAGKGGTPATKYLGPLVSGGDRSLKGFERALARIGVLPQGMAAVPGKAVTLDGFGNFPKPLLIQLLSYFRAFGEQGFKANITDKRRDKLRKGTKAKRGFTYFALRQARGKLLPGIYRRTDFGELGSAVEPILIFVPDIPNYERRIDFYGVANKVQRAVFDAEFGKAMAQALATAR